MRRISWVFTVLATLVAAPASSQPVAGRPAGSEPDWDLNVSIGAFAARLEDDDAGYYDNWWSDGRYAASIGYYWTRQFKTEFEYAVTGEGSHYIMDFARVPGTPYTHPIQVEVRSRLQQASIRGVWQPLDNTWVQPYLNFGGLLEVDRVRLHSDEQYDLGAGRAPIRVRPELNSGPVYDYRPAATLGGGAKFYVSTNSYINSGVQFTWADVATRNFTFLAGFGIDF